MGGEKGEEDGSAAWTVTRCGIATGKPQPESHGVMTVEGKQVQFLPEPLATRVEGQAGCPAADMETAGK